LVVVILNFFDRLSAIVLRYSPGESMNSGLTTYGLKSLVWEKLLEISSVPPAPVTGLRLRSDLVEVM
jgi:hypothetical protein